MGVIVQQDDITGIGVEGNLVDDDPDPDTPLRRSQEALGGDSANAAGQTRTSTSPSTRIHVNRNNRETLCHSPD